MTNPLPTALTVDQLRAACGVLGLPFTDLARVSLMPNTVVVDHLATVDGGRRVLTTISIPVTRTGPVDLWATLLVATEDDDPRGPLPDLDPSAYGPDAVELDPPVWRDPDPAEWPGDPSGISGLPDTHPLRRQP